MLGTIYFEGYLNTLKSMPAKMSCFFGHAAASSLLCGRNLSTIPVTLLGRMLYAGVGPIYQPLQSQQRAVGAAEQPACLHRGPSGKSRRKDLRKQP